MIKAQIQDQELLTHLQKLPKDDMVVFVLADGRARGALFHGTHFVNQMRAQHNTGILETMVLGQASLCGALLLPTLQGKEHVTWRYEVDGPAEGGFTRTRGTDHDYDLSLFYAQIYAFKDLVIPVALCQLFDLDQCFHETCSFIFFPAARRV